MRKLGRLFEQRVAMSFHPNRTLFGDWDFEIYIRTEFTLQSQNAMRVYIIGVSIYMHIFFMAKTLDEIIVREPFKRKSPGCLILYTPLAPFTFDGNKTSPNHSFWFSVSYASTIQVSINF